jgi:hypothetical protein
MPGRDPERVALLIMSGMSQFDSGSTRHCSRLKLRSIISENCPGLRWLGNDNNKSLF